MKAMKVTKTNPKNKPTKKTNTKPTNQPKPKPSKPKPTNQQLRELEERNCPMTHISLQIWFESTDFLILK